MKNRNICLSVALLGIAAVIALSSLGLLGSFQSGTIFFVALMAIISISSLTRLWFAGFFFPIAVLYIRYGDALGLPVFKKWEVIVITACVSFAFDIIFDSLRKKRELHNNHGHHGRRETTVEGTENEDFFFEKAYFCSKIRYVNSKNFTGGKLECHLASMKVFLDKVEVPSAKCTLDVECDLGTVELFIPKNWMVETYLEKTLSNVEDCYYNEPSTDCSVTFIIRGELNLANLHINRV